jgi:hypothetical protein
MPLVRRRPLLRAAAIGGGAYMAGKGQMRSQQQQAQIAELEAQQAPPAPVAPPPVAAPPAAGPDPIEQLTQLGRLREQGVLTDEEFAAQKAKILGG